MRQPDQILERVGEGFRAPLGQESTQTGLDPGRVNQLALALATGRQARIDGVRVAVFRDEVVDFSSETAAIAAASSPTP